MTQSRLAIFSPAEPTGDLPPSPLPLWCRQCGKRGFPFGAELNLFKPPRSHPPIATPTSAQTVGMAIDWRGTKICFSPSPRRFLLFVCCSSLEIRPSNESHFCVSIQKWFFLVHLLLLRNFRPHLVSVSLFICTLGQEKDETRDGASWSLPKGNGYIQLFVRKCWQG